MSKSPLLVTGASGHLGARVVELLLESGAGPLIATTRNPASLERFRARGVDVRFADFDDEASLVAAFQGAGRALLVSTDALGVPGKRERQHLAAVRAFETAGVEHVVYTSLPNPDRSAASIAPDHAATEKALKDSKLGYTVLRNNLYSDLFLLSLPGVVASGQLVDARADGKTAYVTREDCARTAAAALADRNATGREIVDVTGPEAITADELAAILSDVVGKKITHLSIPASALLEGMIQHGLPKPMAEVYASFDVSIARGELAEATGTVKKWTGRTPTTVREFLSANRAALGA